MWTALSAVGPRTASCRPPSNSWRRWVGAILPLQPTSTEHSFTTLAWTSKCVAPKIKTPAPPYTNTSLQPLRGGLPG